MKNTIFLIVALSITGCVEYEPSAAIAQLTNSCEQGNMDSCKSIAELEQRNYEFQTEVYSYKPIYLDPKDFTQPVERTRVSQHSFNCDNLGTPYVVEPCYLQ